MPKKKLTKAQVKRKLKTASNALYDLFLDKFAHGSQSHVSASPGKLMELHAKVAGMLTRVK